MGFIAGVLVRHYYYHEERKRRERAEKEWCPFQPDE